jgi:hypothetical protein
MWGGGEGGSRRLCMMCCFVRWTHVYGGGRLLEAFGIYHVHGVTTKDKAFVGTHYRVNGDHMQCDVV